MTLYFAPYAFSNGRLAYYQENIGGCKVCDETTKEVECKEVKELREVLEEKDNTIVYLNHLNDTLKETKQKLNLRLLEKDRIISSRDRSLINYGDSTKKLMEENNSLRNTSTIYEVREEVERLKTILETKNQHIASLNDAVDSLSDKAEVYKKQFLAAEKGFVQAHNERIDLKKKVEDLESKLNYKTAALEMQLTRSKELVKERNRALDEKDLALRAKKVLEIRIKNAHGVLEGNSLSPFHTLNVT